VDPVVPKLSLQRVAFELIVVSFVVHSIEAQEVAAPTSESWNEADPQDRQTRVQTAQQLFEAKEYAQALHALGWIADDHAVPMEVKLLSGMLWEQNDDLARAARFYQEVVADLGRTSVPVNVNLRLGTVLVRQDKYTEALPVLIDATKYPDALEDTRVFFLLGTALEHSGDPYLAAAREAFGRAVVADPGSPETHAGFDRVSTRIHKAGLAHVRDFPLTLPALPRNISEREILKFPDPDGSPIAQRLFLARRLFAYGARFESDGLSKIAQRYRAAAEYAALGDADRNLADGRADACIAELQKVESERSFEKLPPAIRQTAVKYEVHAYVRAEHFLPAATAVAFLSGMQPPPDRGDVLLLDLMVGQAAIEAVSFDRKNGQPRREDFDEFVDTAELDALYIADKTASWPLGPRSAGVTPARRQPYGMLSASEDFAEIGAAVGLAKESISARDRLRTILIKRIRDKKFELPVKFSLHQVGAGFLEDTLFDGSTSLMRYLEEEIEKAGADGVSEITLDAYAAGRKLASIFADPKSGLPETHD
jgi:tetratricopeptide (TPR) repeat protein